MRAYNFSAGPSMLPSEVLQKIQTEISSFQEGKYWVAEFSHRDKKFMDILENCKAKFKKILSIPNDYEIVFNQGGASFQFPLLSLNFLQKNQKAGYLINGHWSNIAYNLVDDKQKIKIIASGEDSNFRTIPDFEITDNGLGYLYFCDNETIHGCEYQQYPTSSVPLIVDTTSNIFSRKIDFSNLAVIVAGSQKNFGISGLGAIIIRKDFLELSKKNSDLMSPIFNFYKIWQQDSMLNTPNTFAIYVADLVLDWINEKGGIEYFEKISTEKSSMLYDFIDNSQIYKNFVDKKYRSRMNIPFETTKNKWDSLFLEKAEENNLLFLKGHKAIGGMRASIYNAMPLDGILKLTNFMKKFENELSFS